MDAGSQEARRKSDSIYYSHRTKSMKTLHSRISPQSRTRCFPFLPNHHFCHYANHWDAWFHLSSKSYFNRMQFIVTKNNAGADVHIEVNTNEAD